MEVDASMIQRGYTNPQGDFAAAIVPQQSLRGGVSTHGRVPVRLYYFPESKHRLAWRSVLARASGRKPRTASPRESQSGQPSEDGVSSSAPRRKVLIVEDEPSIRNVLYVLLAALGCEGDVAYTGRQALAAIRRESFDAVLLDLRCCGLPPERVVSEIKELCPNLVGRVLVITGEVTGRTTMEAIEHLCIPHISRSHVVEELSGCLRSLFGLSPSPAD